MTSVKTFVVLGMHRSATSLTAKGISSIVNMGDRLLRPGTDNPEGFYEDIDFIRLNDRILKSAGGSWDNPPTVEAIMNQDFTAEIKDLITRKENRLWGWKDPRTCLTIPLIHPYLTNPHYICNFRKPIEVAKSLNERDGFSIDKGMKLAEIYNTRIIDFMRGFTK